MTGRTTQLTFDGDNDDPIWSPDGTRIAFTKGSLQNGEDVFIKPVDNSAPELELLSLSGNQNPTAWPDSATILIQSEAAGQPDLLVMSTKPGDKPRPYLEAPWSESEMQLSPDGTCGSATTRCHWESGSCRLRN
jgi:Tol biopolymer transport system component